MATTRGSTHSVVRLMKRPVGVPKPGVDLVVAREARPTERNVKDGQVLVKTLFASIDPAMRGWMSADKSYLPPVEIGGVMRSGTVAEVVFSRFQGLKPGDVVNTGLHVGMTEYGVVDGKLVGRVQVDPQLPVSADLGVLGGTGMTAYFGMLEIGQPKAGETVVVSAAAGATGSVAAQIAKHVFGCRVVGIAGGPKKCAWLKDHLKLDYAIDYKEHTGRAFAKELKKACPNGIDIFYDNVGGWILNEVLGRINFKARIVMCGAISTYNATTPPPGPSRINALIVNSARMEGFILMNYAKRYREAKSKLRTWIKEGKIKFAEEVVDGIENGPDTILNLFKGSNSGKLVIKVHEPARMARL